MMLAVIVASLAVALISVAIILLVVCVVARHKSSKPVAIDPRRGQALESVSVGEAVGGHHLDGQYGSNVMGPRVLEPVY